MNCYVVQVETIKFCSVKKNLLNALTIGIDWIITARVFNPFQTIHAQLVEFFTKQQTLDFTKSKELAENDFKFNKIGSKFSKWVENTVGKGEIAESRTISPFPTVFSKDLYCRHVKKPGLVWQRVKAFFNMVGNHLKTLWESFFINIV